MTTWIDVTKTKIRGVKQAIASLKAYFEEAEIHPQVQRMLLEPWEEDLADLQQQLEELENDESE